MNLIKSILLSSLAVVSLNLFGQKDYLTETNAAFSDASAEASKYNQDANMVSLESQGKRMEVLALTPVTENELNFELNPGSSNLVFSLVANYSVFSGVEYAIYNSEGSEISRQQLSDKNTVINLNGLNSGTYILHIYISEDRFQVFRIKII